jgi:hypothetical protein
MGIVPRRTRINRHATHALAEGRATCVGDGRPATFWLDDQKYFSLDALVAAAPVKAVRSTGRRQRSQIPSYQLEQGIKQLEALSPSPLQINGHCQNMMAPSSHKSRASRRFSSLRSSAK